MLISNLCLQLIYLKIMQKSDKYLFNHDIEYLLMPLKCVIFDYSILKLLQNDHFQCKYANYKNINNQNFNQEKHVNFLQKKKIDYHIINKENLRSQSKCEYSNLKSQYYEFQKIQKTYLKANQSQIVLNFDNNTISEQLRSLLLLFKRIIEENIKFFIVTDQNQNIIQRLKIQKNSKINSINQYLKQFTNLFGINILKDNFKSSQNFLKGISQILQQNIIQTHEILCICDYDNEKNSQYLKNVYCNFLNIKSFPSLKQLLKKFQIIIKNSKIIKSYKQTNKLPSINVRIQKKMLNLFQKNKILNHKIQTKEELRMFLMQIFERFSYIRFRQVEKIVHKQFMIENDSQKLQQNVLNAISKILFQSGYVDNLDFGKKIKLIQENNENVNENHQKQKYILYEVNLKKYEMILEKYEVLKRNKINTPNIINTDQDKLNIKFEYISKRTSDMNINQIVQLKQKFLEVLKQLLRIQQGQIRNVQRIDLATTYLKEFQMEWSFFTEKTQLKTKKLVQDICEVMNQILAEIPRKVIHTDMNYTNILIQNEEIYLIDYENMIIGPILHDIVFLIADKFRILPENYCQYLIQNYYKILKKRQIYLKNYETFCNQVYIYAFQKLLRVLFQCCRVYMFRYKSHQMNLISLIGQLYYYGSKCTFMKEQKNIQLKQNRMNIICSIIQQFINKYTMISSYEKLAQLPTQIFVFFEKNHIQNELWKNIQNRNPEVAFVCVADIVMENRKNWLAGHLNLHIDMITDDVCKRIFQQSLFSPNAYKIQNFSEETMKAIETLNVQKILKQENIEIIRQIFAILNQNKQKKMIIKTCNQQIVKQLKKLLPLKVIFTLDWIQNHYNQNINISNHNFFVKEKDLILWQSQQQKQIKELQFILDASKITGIILAAGYGSRFAYKQKYLLTLEDITLLERNILNFKSLGITQVIIAELQKKISQKNYFKNYPQMNIRYVSYEEPKGSGATIVDCCKEAKTQKSLIVCGDNFYTLNLSDLKYDDQTYYGCILLKKSKDLQARYSFDSNLGIVKIAAQYQDRNYYNCVGIYQNKCILESIPSDKEKYEFAVVLDKLLEQYKITGIYLKENQILCNINTQEEYNQTKNIFENLPKNQSKKINFEYFLSNKKINHQKN